MHSPVMLSEVLEHLAPADGETYIDGTFGFGGYSQAVLERANCRLVALDRDPTVLPRVRELEERYKDRFDFHQTQFSKLDTLNIGPVHAVILDIGISSMQVDNADRGFSFMRSGPLDMRMGDRGPTAADVVRELDQDVLTQIFRAYGEERQARRAAQAIIKVRENGRINTTDGLAELLEEALGRYGKKHPATQIFQALRIFVNDELGELYRALCAAERILRPGGRLIIVSFHSLEDRIVKQFLKRRGERPQGGSRHLPHIEVDYPNLSFSIKTRSALKPSQSEIKANLRSRSAKLRVAVRTEALPFDNDETVLPRAPSVNDFEWTS